MRKAAILVLIIFSFLAGCDSGQYAIERRYWQVEKQAEKIFKNPHASPPKELENAVNSLNKFIQKYPNNDLSVNAEFNIAHLYIAKNEFAKARAQLKLLMDKYAKSQTILSEALFLTGNSYEIEDKWDLALAEYKKIMQEYATTRRGLDIPIYIAQHYKIKYQPDKMIAAYQEAIAHYGALSAKFPNTPLAYNADTLVAQSYIALKDKVKAKEALEKLIKDYPKSKLIKTATAMLKELEEK